MKQMNLFNAKTNNEFGGSLLTGKRRTARPLDSRKPIHLILKATNSSVLLKNRREAESILHGHAKRTGIKIHDCGIHADHIHLSMKIPNRLLYVRWIRAVTSILVGRFRGLKWKLRPYTRVATWGKPFRILLRYIRKNREEGNLIIEAQDRLANFRTALFRELEGFSRI